MSGGLVIENVIANNVSSKGGNLKLNAGADCELTISDGGGTCIIDSNHPLEIVNIQPIPSGPNSATTKSYVDTAVAGGGTVSYMNIWQNTTIPHEVLPAWPGGTPKPNIFDIVFNGTRTRPQFDQAYLKDYPTPGANTLPAGIFAGNASYYQSSSVPNGWNIFNSANKYAVNAAGAADTEVGRGYIELQGPCMVSYTVTVHLPTGTTPGNYLVYTRLELQQSGTGWPMDPPPPGYAPLGTTAYTTPPAGGPNTFVVQNAGYGNLTLDDPHITIPLHTYLPQQTVGTLMNLSIDCAVPIIIEFVNVTIH